jgi:hypothetical protein
MALLRTDIERALDDLVSNEEGMRFQGLAVVLGRQRWPELIACERKKDLGLDAYASASLAPDKIGKGLASSITGELKKISSDAGTAKRNFNDLSALIFVTAGKVGNKKRVDWAGEIRKTHGLDLHIISREDVITSLMLPANASLCASFLGIAIEVEPGQADLIARLRQVVHDVAAAWATKLKGHPVIDLSSVRLDQGGAESAEVFSLAGIQTALAESRRIVLEAPAGRGKTTTLIELAQRHAAAGQSAFLIDLPAWTASGLGLLEYVAGMPSFQAQGIDARALARAQEWEHFSFLLNGWNEIAESSSPQAQHKLRELDRAFPAAGIIVATRTHHIVPPLPGAVRLRLLTLTRRQRTVYLRARLGDTTAELQPQLDADAVLDELTRTPFILSEVVSLFERGAPIPSTKMGVLAAVVRLLEEAPEHRNELQVAPLSGRQADYLRALATEMTSQGAVALPEATSRAIARAAGQSLVDGGQLAAVPEPAAVLAMLTAHHVLERTEYPTVVFQFEHQQFQEHYAAIGIQARLFDLPAADGDAKRRFIADFVNDPAWAEPLRMIAEIIGARTDNEDTRRQNVRAGRLLVEMALLVDPIFAAELARLCGDDVWKEVGGTLAARLREWHGVRDERHRECALAAMLASGSSEFQDIVVPLLSGDEEQARLHTYRLWPEFHLSSLGGDWQGRVQGWSEEARADFVSEVLHQRLVPAIVPFAVADASRKVKKAAVSSLAWTGASEEAAQVLESMDADSFSQAARELSPEYLPAGVRPRIVAVLQQLLDTADDPWERLRAVMKLLEMGEPDLDARLKNVLDDIPTAEVQKHGHYQVRTALDILRRSDPVWVSQWVAARIADGGLWPDHWIAFVTSVPDELVERILQRLENEDFNHKPFGGIIAVLKVAANQKLAARVFASLRARRAAVLASPDQKHDFERAVERQLEALFQALPVDAGIAGVLASLAGPPDPIDVEVTTRLLSRVARSDLEPITGLDPGLKAAMREYLKKSIAVVLAEDDFSGEQKAALASSISQLGEPEDMADLITLIHADIERMTKGRAARAAGDRGPRGNGASMSYAPWHVSAVVHLDSEGATGVLIDLLREPRYTEFAAEAMARSGLTAVKPLVDNSSRYRQIWIAREGRLPPSAQGEQRKLYAAAIAEHIRRLLDERRGGARPESTYALTRLANALAAIDGVAFAGLVLEVMALPDDGDDWQRVEAAEHLLSSGVVLPTADTLALVDGVLDRRQKYGSQDQDKWWVKRYLNLLPFVDDPRRGIQKLREVVTKARFAEYECRDLVTAVGESRSDAALDLLRDLASSQKDLTHYDEPWINAVARLDTLPARELLLGFVDPTIPGLGDDIKLRRDDVLAARITDIARRSPEVEARLRRLAETDLPPLKRLRLAAVLNAIATPETLVAGLMLIDDRVRPAVPQHTFNHLEATFVERRQYRESENSYTLAARAANVVRTTLFEMVTKDDRRKKSAFGLLGQIEEWRLEYGRPIGEPRHPALQSGERWPPTEPAS